MDALTPTTELEAVNEMLRAIGESPVSSIDTGNADVQTCVDLLRQHSIKTQKHGWWFNTDYEYELTPDGSGFLLLPSNTLKVDVTDADKYLKSYVIRGSKLYDNIEHTSVFTEVVEVDIVVGLDWTDLPQTARDYIISCAGLEFVDTDIGDQTRHAFTQKRRDEAYVALLQEQAEAGDFNMLLDSATGRELLDRRI